MKEVAELSARKLSQWLEEQKLAMEPDEYLALLNRARDYRGQRI